MIVDGGVAVPEFFHAPVFVHDGVAEVDFLTWDREGNRVRVNFAAILCADPVRNETVLTSLQAAAWQGVWLAAQSTSEEVAGRVEFTLPKETLQ